MKLICDVFTESVTRVFHTLAYRLKKKKKKGKAADLICMLHFTDGKTEAQGRV